MIAKLIRRRAVRCQRRAKAIHRVRDDAPDQRLLCGEVIVEGRDIQTDARGDLARAQPLETPLGDLVEGGLDERLLTVLLVRARGMRDGGDAAHSFN